MSTQGIKEKMLATVRHPQFWGFFISMAVMAIVSVAFFAPDNFSSNVLQQHDMQQGAANGEEGRAFEEATGEKALWTNALFSGMPTFQISPEYPSNHLFTWLNDVYGLWLPAPSNLLFMMMMGMLIMCYCLRMRWWYALIAALAWGLSSYFVIIIGAGHIWKFVALTYMPPTIGAVIMAYRGKYLYGGSLLALFAMLELNANHPQITYYSMFIMAALAIAFLVQAIREKHMRSWLTSSAVCLVAGALALGANSPSLYNTYEYSKQTKRAQSELTPLAVENAEPAERPTGGLPKAEIGGWSNTPSESFSLIVPNIKGGATIRPEKGQNTFLSLDKLPDYDYTMQSNDIFGIVPQFGQYFGGKGMTNGPFYLGAIICALFLVGCFIVHGPVKWALLVVTLFSILLAMGNHFEALTDFMIYNFPLYNKFRAAETALVIAAFSVPLLAAMALQKLAVTPDALKTYRREIIIGFGLPALVALVAWVAPSAFGEPFGEDELLYLDQARQQLGGQPVYVQDAFKSTLDNIASLRLGLVSADGLRSLGFLVVGALLVMAIAGTKMPKWAGIAALGFIVVCDLYTVDKRYISSESFVAATDSEPLAPDALDRQILQDKGYYRVADFDAFGDARRSFYHHMVGGYHAAKLNRYNDLIERGMINRPNVLDMLNARYIIMGHQVTRNDNALGAAWLVDGITYVDGADAEFAALQDLNTASEAVADRAYESVLGSSVPSAVPGDTIVLKSQNPNEYTYDVTTRNGGLAVFSEVWFPWGWHAEIDGKETALGRVNYVLRAMKVPAGHHTVTMRFDPQSIHTTGSIAYASVTVIYIFVLLSMFWFLIEEEDKKRLTHRSHKH